MKKNSSFLLVAAITAITLSTAAFADPDKGQKVIIKELKPLCGFDGGVLAKKHKQAEWKKIFDDGKLNDEITKICPKAKPIKDKFLPDVYDFLHYYASDSGNVPAC